MKTILIVLILATNLSAQMVTDTAKQISSEFRQSQDQVTAYYQGKADGAAASRKSYDGLGWWVGGFASVLIMAPMIVYSQAASGTVSIPEKYELHVRKKSALYQIGFREAYSQEAKDRRKGYVAVGAFASTAVIVLLVLLPN